MVRIPFLFPTRKNLSGIDSSAKKPLVLIWTKKSLFEDFHRKIFIWKRKRWNSKLQDRCAYQTTTNIALLCKMVRIPFLFPTQTFQVLTPQPKSLWSWFGQTKHFLKTLTYRFLIWKKHSNSNFQDRCAYQTTTNIALLCEMVRIPFLFPTRKNLSGIDSSAKKPLVLIWTKKSLFEDFHRKIFIWKRKRSNSKLQDRCAYPTTTNIALLCKMVRIPFLFPTRKNLSGIDCPTNAFGRDLDKKITFGMFSHKDF